jgi:hypothetical protein
VTEKKNLLINQLFYLQHFQDGWESGKWEEKYKFENCINKLPYRYFSQLLICVFHQSAYINKMYMLLTTLERPKMVQSKAGFGVMKKSKFETLVVSHFKVTFGNSYQFYHSTQRNLET